MFLKNRNIISKMKRSKVTDYAALTSFEAVKLRSLVQDLSNLKITGHALPAEVELQIL